MAADGTVVERGFPHLSTVRAAITALYERLSPAGVQGFATSVPPVDVAFDQDEDLTAGIRRIARTMVQHLRLPDARISVRFRDMPEAAWVELTDGPEYAVELHPRFARHRQDIGAVLAHEVMHIFLHRSGLSCVDTTDNELLTDTAATYLGAGWLLLDAFRQDALSSQKLGYLTPEEYGYVLAKRAALMGEDPRVWFTSPLAYEAYAEGRRLQRRDATQPPLADSGWTDRQRYTVRRKLALEGGRDVGRLTGGAYSFETGAQAAVVFPCPVCHQRIRLPVRGRLRARCGLCRTVLECDT